jgi:hypothetical protein
MKIGDKVKYKTSKSSFQTYYGNILSFKADKIHVSKHRFSDHSGKLVDTYIDVEDLIK